MIRTNQGELSDSQQIAEEMNSYFSSCVGSSNPVMGVVKDPEIPPVNARFEFTEIDKETVLRHLTNLNERKATGADGISAKLSRMAAPGISNKLDCGPCALHCLGSKWLRMSTSLSSSLTQLVLSLCGYSTSLTT